MWDDRFSPPETGALSPAQVMSRRASESATLFELEIRRKMDIWMLGGSDGQGAKCLHEQPKDPIMNFCNVGTRLCLFFHIVRSGQR